MSEEGTDLDSRFAQEEANGDVEPRKSCSSRESPPPPTGQCDEDHEEMSTYVRFLLSNAEAGSVIGKGGSTISDFKAKSGAHIQLSRNYETFPGTSDRIALVSGTIDDVLKAVDLIMSKLLDEFYAGEEEDVDPHFQLRLVVPNGSCGGIIGKGGSTIKSFIESSGAYIKISPLDNSYPGLYDRLVTVNGNLGDQMQAIELILIKLTEDPQYTQSVVAPYVYAGNVKHYNGGQYGSNGIRGKFPNGGIQNKGHLQEEKSSSVTIGVSDEHIGLVLGRGGRNIAEISQVSGAKLRISDRGDFMSGTSDRKVTITGSQRSIRVAETMINGKLASVVERG